MSPSAPFLVLLGPLGEEGLALGPQFHWDWDKDGPTMSLRGLEALESVDGDLTLGLGPEDYAPLSNLRRVGGWLTLVGNVCPEFPSLESVGGVSTQGLSSCDFSWLQFATSLPLGLEISLNDARTLRGLEGLVSVGEDGRGRLLIGGG